jgi:hypothetical protein
MFKKNDDADFVPPLQGLRQVKGLDLCAARQQAGDDDGHFFIHGQEDSRMIRDRDLKGNERERYTFLKNFIMK